MTNVPVWNSFNYACASFFSHSIKFRGSGVSRVWQTWRVPWAPLWGGAKLLRKNWNYDQTVVLWHNSTIRHCDRTRTLACHAGT